MSQNPPPQQPGWSQSGGYGQQPPPQGYPPQQPGYGPPAQGGYPPQPGGYPPPGGYPRRAATRPNPWGGSLRHSSRAAIHPKAVATGSNLRHHLDRPERRARC